MNNITLSIEIAYELNKIISKTKFYQIDNFAVVHGIVQGVLAEHNILLQEEIEIVNKLLEIHSLTTDLNININETFKALYDAGHDGELDKAYRVTIESQYVMEKMRLLAFTDDTLFVQPETTGLNSWTGEDFLEFDIDTIIERDSVDYNKLVQYLIGQCNKFGIKPIK